MQSLIKIAIHSFSGPEGINEPQKCEKKWFFAPNLFVGGASVLCLQLSQRTTAVGDHMITALTTCMPPLASSFSFIQYVVAKWRATSQPIGLFQQIEPTYKNWSRVSKQALCTQASTMISWPL